jgi:hypothetical protein
MDTKKPLKITPAEWQEIVQLTEVREGWGLTDDETPEVFAESVYAVKFAFVSGGPGYVGDLYIIHGDSLGGPPLVLTRGQTGALKVVQY